MVSKKRLERISERIYQELSEMLIYEVKDPRLSGVFITDVKVDRELAYADIYIATSVDEHHTTTSKQRIQEVVEAFNHASGFFRSQLATRLDLRIFPRLRFHWDPTPERAANIEELIASLHEDSPPATDERSQTDASNLVGDAGDEEIFSGSREREDDG